MNVQYSTVYARVVFLRHLGVLHPHATEDWALVGDAFCTYGLVETDRDPEGGKGTRCLVIRKEQPYQSNPFRLYQPTLVEVAAEYIHVRGVESTRLQGGATAAVVQEWVVFPRLKPPVS